MSGSVWFPEEAIEEYDELIETNPDYALYYNNKGYCLNALERYEEALIVINEGIEIDDNNKNLYKNKAISLMETGEYDEALIAVNKSLEIDSSYDKAIKVKEELLERINSDNEWLEWEEKTDVPIDKKWTIKFNGNIAAETAAEKNIYVKDASGSNINIDIEVGEDGESMIVEPVDQYQNGQIYYLYIGKEIQSENGMKLEEGIKMKFTIGNN